MLDGSAILRIAFGPAPPTAAISTLNGLYYMDPFAEGVHPSKPCGLLFMSSRDVIAPP